MHLQIKYVPEKNIRKSTSKGQFILTLNLHWVPQTDLEPKYHPACLGLLILRQSLAIQYRTYCSTVVTFQYCQISFNPLLRGLS